jgi:hypothetical protein
MNEQAMYDLYVEDMLRQRVRYVPYNTPPGHWTLDLRNWDTPLVTSPVAKPAKPMKPPVAVPLSELMSELEEAGTERIKLFV